MNNLIRKLVLATSFLGMEPELWAEPAASSPPDIAAAISMLRDHYVGFAKLHCKPGDELQDLATRSNGGIWLEIPGTKRPAIYTAYLPGNIGYVRLASFTPATTWNDLAVGLNQWQDVQGIVLDLRSNASPDDMTGAAQTAVLFDYLSANPFAMAAQANFVHLAHPISQPLIVLINHQTRGAAEACAYVLQHHGALVMGRSSVGIPETFTVQSLPSGQLLHYATDPVHLADGTAIPVQPLTPDVGLLLNDQAEKRALTLVDENDVLEVIQAKAERQRMSEASLVKGEDPERDQFLATMDKNSSVGRLSLPTVEDAALIQALDSLTAIRVSQRVPAPTGGQPAPVASSASR